VRTECSELAARYAADLGASTGATQPGASISVVVSPAYAAEQVMKTIQTREEWLDWYSLPLDYVMRDETDRQGFLRWVRGEYEQTDFIVQSWKNRFSGSRFIVQILWVQIFADAVLERNDS